ncbi:MAG: hypothetical protein II627_04325, partial [Lachnospiraceae bacterium]|nr:hypothetical protein [Lachnospiraceae bacterium]
MKLILVSENDGGSRLDKYLGRLLKEAGSSFIYKMLRKKNITLNGSKATGSEHLKAGDEIRLFFSDETFAKFTGSLISDNMESGHDRKTADRGSGHDRKTAGQGSGHDQKTADRGSIYDQKKAGRGSGQTGKLQFRDGSKKDQKLSLSRMPEIIYQDDHVIMFNKPAGMLSQKAEPEDISLNEYLLAYLEEQGLWEPVTST